MISKLTNASAAVTPSSAEPFDRRVLVVGGAAVAVLMAVSGQYGLRQFFTSVRAVATLSNPYGLRHQEFGGHVLPVHRAASSVGPDVAGDA
jgi:hypothetical protein